MKSKEAFLFLGSGQAGKRQEVSALVPVDKKRRGG
jgi:hypothetical protein